MEYFVVLREENDEVQLKVEQGAPPGGVLCQQLLLTEEWEAALSRNWNEPGCRGCVSAIAQGVWELETSGQVKVKLTTEQAIFSHKKGYGILQVAILIRFAVQTLARKRKEACHV